LLDFELDGLTRGDLGSRGLTAHNAEATMTVGVTAAALAALLQGAASVPLSYSLVCRSDQATGFNSVNGEWRRVTFLAETRVIRIEAAESCFDRRPPPLGFGGGRSRNICVNVSKLGEEQVPALTSACEEIVSSERPNRALINCRTIFHTFSAYSDGPYHWATVHNQFEPIPPLGRDSLVVEVGRCSRT
jgi:hypothetical protein